MGKTTTTHLCCKAAHVAWEEAQADFENANTHTVDILEELERVPEDADEDEDFTTVGKGGKTVQLTPESIYKNLQAIQEARGKKVRRFPWLSFGRYADC